MWDGTYHADIALASTGDDEADFRNIEAAAAGWLAAGWQPEDAEPGAWLHLTKDGLRVQIQVHA